ncbi:MAG: DUF3524 domain-containing protein [Desulfobacter sp.]|nr:DUF3524 domain-containing protein [Desulfobacter sp.]WDP85438.1 MAG: DUF3524 domain-containing protein [Desulfobacter sp.]
MKVLFLEPFYGGSHKDVAKGFARFSSHEVSVITLPPRFWKWRMRGAALYFIREIKDLSAYDLIFATDMMDLTDFKGLAGPDCPPIALYFHENQLSYPLGPHEKRDFHLGFTNIVSALACDGLFFNSRFHLDDFLTAARQLIKQMPDTRPLWMMDELKEKAQVLYPGYRVKGAGLNLGRNDQTPPLVIWNHRWEYDKNPDLFFKVLGQLKSKGVKFQLALMGEQYEIIPKVFEQAQKDFQAELLVYGFQAVEETYWDWLSKGTVVVSTAIQENFGISVMEAVAHGCFPLLPNRLSYLELIPKDLKKEVIYSSESGLLNRLEQVLTLSEQYLPARKVLSEHAIGFSWEILARRWDMMLEKIRKIP